jgi:hypothetical protein
LYNMTVSNLGPIGAQIARIYINSTGSGCTVNAGYCVLNPAAAPTAYAFNKYDAFLNPGEFSHIVRLWLPKTVFLPNQTLTPSNTVSIVTTRGRVFTFQYPFPSAGPAEPGTGKTPTIQTGSMRIAYNAANANSTKEGSGGTSPAYCHYETSKETWPAGATGTLTFVNPWITKQILKTVCSPTGSCANLYVYASTNNSLTIPLLINSGNMIMTVSDATSNAKSYFIGGPLLGVVYPLLPANGGPQFTPAGTSVSIAPGARFILIFKIVATSVTSSSSDPSNDVFSGTASVSNGAGSTPGIGFRQAAIYLDGFYIRSTC